MLQESFRKLCEETSEIMLYFTINTLGGFIWRMNHDLADGRIPESKEMDAALAEAQEKIEFAVDHTNRFGVDIPRVNGKATEAYCRWFRWWDSYAQGLSKGEFDRLNRVLSKKKDVSKWRPAGDWRTVAAAG